MKLKSLVLSHLLFPLAVLSMDLPKSDEIKKQIKKYATTDDAQINWNLLLPYVDQLNHADAKECRQDLVKSTLRHLFLLAQHVQESDQQRSVELSGAHMKLYQHEFSSGVSLPAAADHVALNTNGSTVAVASGNTLKIVAKNPRSEIAIAKQSGRYPINGIAFTNEKILAMAHERAQCLLDSQTAKIHSATQTSPESILSLVSPNGKWTVTDRHERSSAHLVFNHIESDKIHSIDLPEIIKGLCFTRFAADAKGEQFALASPSRLIFIRCLQEALSGLEMVHTLLIPENQRPTHIADIDISADGKKIIAVGNKQFWFYSLQDDPEKVSTLHGDLGFDLYAARINPLNGFLTLAGLKHILYCDSRMKEYRGVSAPEKIRALAISADGLSCAAAGDHNLYIDNCTNLIAQLSVAELLLLKRLSGNEKSQAIFSDSRFVQLFRNIKSNDIKKRMMKLFDINYTQLGYETCCACAKTFADHALACTHPICSECKMEWKNEHEGVCPRCHTVVEGW